MFSKLKYIPTPSPAAVHSITGNSEILELHYNRTNMHFVCVSLHRAFVPPLFVRLSRHSSSCFSRLVSLFSHLCRLIIELKIHLRINLSVVHLQMLLATYECLLVVRSRIVCDCKIFTFADVDGKMS